MNVVVTGIGLISALGSLETTWKQLLAGISGIQQHQPFAELEPKPLGLIGKHPAQLQELVRRSVLDAIADAGLSLPLPDCGVVIGSSRGNQAQWEELVRSRSFSHPHSLMSIPFLDTLPHTAAITTAHLICTAAAVRSPMAACATGLWAIAQGYELVRSGEYERVIAGAVEAPITPLTIAGFDQMGALAKTGAYPFDCDREGLVLGEGGAVFVLESEPVAKSRCAKVYGYIKGFGLTADGYHVSAPEPSNRPAITAITQCLQRSGLEAQNIDYIHAHGTATQLNDHNEAQLIQQLFPDSVPISSTKGATGHAIGASGALGAAFCLLALKHQLLPPNLGLRRTDLGLNLVLSARPAVVHNTLCLSFGFGGQNAAIAFTRAKLAIEDWAVATPVGVDLVQSEVVDLW
ncbi:3-oxoacyl-(acyl-carrier-protein) synthase [Leptolyngbyaceae cyanobacterium JSC-12]|nr:3-oxoacyl-(acyl-carrier-protein) synthase [Leptolyngbyaceae cyanobacterium JSC-12]